MKEKFHDVKNLIIKMRKKLLLSIRNVENFLIRNRYVSGVTVIEMVLILVIIIALLLIFKSQLIDLINTIFDKITSESSGI